MENVIECNNITHYYGERLIYENLNFNVGRGKILGLLGKNGTGKTTIINILCGYLRPTAGSCSIFGENVLQLSPQTKARIGLQLEGHIQHSYFNVKQIEQFYSQFFPNWNKDAYYELTNKLKITEKQKISTMSCGQRSQIALGLIFAQNPDLLILDDFSMGLDPGYRRLFIEYLKEYVEHGNKTVFLTSHIIQDMEMLIDDCMVFDYGRVLLHMPTKEITENFRKYTFSSNAKVIEPTEGLWHPEKIGNTWEVFSFDPQNVVTEKLAKYSISELKSEATNLEDAFIGLTGKY